ncbi:hypothetical protein C1J03_11735 [Sulfitobacter sp. SK012]|uniref:TAXI family TRAP transporter solute-binding subunit n=1 Tax=Sulfitobacter sp. SK012 TaxID=1389005 RepID=UPI000E0A740A|nr:TAXI family TRAP transporter solute-binding subunit [Sulfitobacter sp. SK012]AXI46631.1 hypothetical protein C1J03_11735 [Sulfitobacter sp. SK012]
MKFFLSALVVASWATSANAENLTFINIGSGSLDGGYYQTAKALCSSINSENSGSVRCSPEPTSGSVYNLRMLQARELDFAFVQSDWQLAAYKGTGLFEGEKMSNLRSVMSLYPEAVTMLAGRDSEIFRSQDIPGKKIDIGLASSGRHATAKEVLRRAGMNVAGYRGFYELTVEQSIRGLCDGTIDASFLVLGHPSELVERALSECGARIIAPSGPVLTRVFSESKGFVPITIPADTYTNQLGEIDTYAVYATLVTRADMASSEVAIVIESTLENLDSLKAQISQLSGLSWKNMATQGLSAPLHPASSVVLENIQKKAAGN